MTLGQRRQDAVGGREPEPQQAQPETRRPRGTFRGERRGGRDGRGGGRHATPRIGGSWRATVLSDALFERFLLWVNGVPLPDGGAPAFGGGRCIFMALSEEYDDRPGEIRDTLVRAQRAWRDTIARGARVAVDAGHFRADLDCEQFAYEFMGVIMSYKHAHKLLDDAGAASRARTAFQGLLARSRRGRR